MSIEIKGGYFNNGVTRKYNSEYRLTNHTIKFYKAMLDAYKNNIGKKTASGNKITEKMISNIKERMFQLMKKVHK